MTKKWIYILMKLRRKLPIHWIEISIIENESARVITEHKEFINLIGWLEHQSLIALCAYDYRAMVSITPKGLYVINDIQ